MRKLAHFFTDDRAATAIEYGLIAAGIALVIITAVNLLGNNLSNVFNEIANDVGGPACVPQKGFGGC